MLNATLGGRLGRSADLTTSKNGTSILKFSVATDQGYGDNKTTTWVNCAMFGDRGTRLAEYLTKGKKVAVVGELSLREYTKRDGTNGASLDMAVSNLEFADSKQDGQDESPRQNPPLQPAPSVAAANIDDDIPF